MLLAIFMLLVCTQLVKTDYVQSRTPLQSSYICNDELIKGIAYKMEALEMTNQKIQSSLHTLNMFNYQQFTELKSAVYNLKVQEEKHEQCTCNATKTLTDLTAASAAGGFRTNANENATFDENSNASGSSSNAPTISIATNTSGFSNGISSFCQIGRNGIQLIQVPNSKLKPFFVNCIQDAQQGDDPWILIQRRRDGSIDFYRDWCDYQQGFGNLEGEFFMGLDKLHALTQSALYELWIQLEDFSNETRWARYSSFAIGDEHQSYALNMLGSFTGNAGDSLIYHEGQKFSTKDKDNDVYSMNCALNYFGAWWYKDCHRSNLNGKYFIAEYSKDKTAKGIDWDTWHGHNYSLKYVHMAIRPVRSN